MTWMSEVSCVNGHELPETYHHGVLAAREPCSTCDSVGRHFPSIEAEGFGLSSLDVAAVFTSVSTSWMTDKAQPNISLIVEITPYGIDGRVQYTVRDGEGNVRASAGFPSDTRKALIEISRAILRELKRNTN